LFSVVSNGRKHTEIIFFMVTSYLGGGIFGMLFTLVPVRSTIKLVLYMGQMRKDLVEWPTAPCRGTGQDVSKQQLVCLGLGRQLRQQKVTNRCRKLQVTASTLCRQSRTR
jgi:hypothetical protein